MFWIGRHHGLSSRSQNGSEPKLYDRKAGEPSYWSIITYIGSFVHNFLIWSEMQTQDPFKGRLKLGRHGAGLEIGQKVSD
ncbi:hypothetical protein [Bdellovibrio bacteriovorus]|uniref:hypothetical protein n=1 Tax=Bdellovibrio bacteriovorus TaxID=959 RepID=UPI0035A5BE3B